ncbi:Uu.00g035970.m01.CDS01 [Anthostomella pinea]|uniref:Uu.00g035970.m01.CDS01 n=1 Tax=Anthostomella pinea TaxID=933095 RepID=A0AAI8YB38_9PEZI|nr:Uu.00g035970.m01.CDS01 [Anthostomella pinea]
MKLNGFVLPALAGVATANTANSEPHHAQAYMLRQSNTLTSTANPPSIPNHVAEAILLQRLSSPEKRFNLGRLSDSLAGDEAVSYINQFGKPPRPLFEQTDASEPNQLVIALSGLTAENYDQVKAAIPRVPLAFTAPGLSQLSVRETPGCAFGPSINPTSAKCWSGKTQYLHYDVSKDRNVVTQLGLNLATLKAQALDGKMETTILLLDSNTAASTPDLEELRRRQLEEELVMSEDLETSTTNTEPTSTPVKAMHAFTAAQPTVVPACFASHNACVTATNECSGHGVCIDRWDKITDQNASCFFCYCESTREYNETQKVSHIYHWGGSMCHKRDVSTPFWLFAGTTIALVSTIAFAIGLLFSIGEEKLPGVIGAGVSRSK